MIKFIVNTTSSASILAAVYFSMHFLKTTITIGLFMDIKLFSRSGLIEIFGADTDS